MERLIAKNINTAEHFNQVFQKNLDIYDSYKNIVFYNRLLGAKMFSGESYLDYGCGGGHSLHNLKKKFPKLAVTGVDISDYCILENRKNYSDCQFLTVNDFLNSNLQVDAILSAHTIEHVEDPIGLIKTLLLRARSSLLIIIPYKDSWGGNEEHLWRFDKNSFAELNPSLVLCGLTNQAGNTELLIFWNKNKHLKIGDLIFKINFFVMVIFKNLFNGVFRVAYGRYKTLKKIFKYENNRPAAGKK
jgi:SAM-dependent methyltransferase